MNTVYRKTDKGDAAIVQRTPQLPTHLRHTLILVDGKKTHAEVAALAKRIAQADPEATLAALQADGLIEACASQVNNSVEPPEQPAAWAQTAPSPGPSTRPLAWLESTRRDAAHHLVARLGPTAEGLAIKIERAKTPEELNELLAGAAQVLRSVRGPGAGREFAERFPAEELA
jgi:hypothetical protein